MKNEIPQIPFVNIHHESPSTDGVKTSSSVLNTAQGQAAQSFVFEGIKTPLADNAEECACSFSAKSNRDTSMFIFRGETCQNVKNPPKELDV